MFTRFNKRIEDKPHINIGSFPNPTELNRGNTAIYPSQNLPKQCFSITSRNINSKNTKITLKGWNSGLQNPKKHPKIRTATHVPRVKMPQQNLVVSTPFRPPSRHKTPTKSTGLQLPVQMGDSSQLSTIQEMFDQTPSRFTSDISLSSPEQQILDKRLNKKGKIRLKQRKKQKQLIRPKTRSSKYLHEIPFTVTTEQVQNRRIFSAKQLAEKQQKIRFESTLDKDFLMLFQ